MPLIFFIFLLVIAFIFRASEARACMTVLVGRNASSTGEVLVAHASEDYSPF